MNKPFIIGIAGGSASGKTTFCIALIEALSEHNIKVFHMDSYFKPNEQKPKSKSPITKKIYVDYNHPDAIDLPQLKKDLSATQEDIVIVEGFFALSDEYIQPIRLEIVHRLPS